MTAPFDPFDDDTLAQLGPILKEEASGYEPSGDSLARIQARTESGSSAPWRTWGAPLAVAAAVASVVAAGVLVSARDDLGRTATPSTSAPSPVLSTPTSTPPPTLSPSADPSRSGEPDPSGSRPDPSQGCVSATTAVGVFFVGQVDGEPYLYRTLRPVDRCAAAREAVRSMFEQPPADPDYASPWPAGTRLLDLDVSDSTATVDLSGFVTAGGAVERQAVQQLVWTITAANPQVERVRVLVNGSTPPSTTEDWSAPVPRADPLGTRANVWLLAPTQGADVGSPVTIRVNGTGYEGNVPVKVFQGDVEVASTAILTEQGVFTEGETTLTLPAGTYEVRVYNDNADDGSLTLWDSKQFTVT